MEKQGLYLKVAESINTLLCQLKNIVLMNTFAWPSYTKAWGALLESKIKIKKIYKKFSIVFIWLKSSFFMLSTILDFSFVKQLLQEIDLSLGVQLPSLHYTSVTKVTMSMERKLRTKQFPWLCILCRITVNTAFVFFF